MAHQSICTTTEGNRILKELTPSQPNPHVDTNDLTQKLSDFARKADLDIQTVLEEQVCDPVLQVLRKWIKTCVTRPQKTPEINQSTAL